MGGGGLEHRHDGAADVDAQGLQRGPGDGGDHGGGGCASGAGSLGGAGSALQSQTQAHDASRGCDLPDRDRETVAGAASRMVIRGQEGDLLGAEAEERGGRGALRRHLDVVAGDVVDGDTVVVGSVVDSGVDSGEASRPDVLDAHNGGDGLVHGGAEDLGGGGDLADGAVDQDDDLVAKAQRLIAVVSDKDGGHAKAADDGGEIIDEGGPGGSIERREGLIQQEHLRLQSECAGQADAARLAAGQPAGVSLGQMPDAEAIEPAEGAFASQAAGNAAEPLPDLHVVKHAAREQQGVLKGGGQAAAGGQDIAAHGGAVEEELAAQGLDEELQDAEERALARAVGADEGGDAAGGEIQRIDVEDGAAVARDRAVADGDLGGGRRVRRSDAPAGPR